MKHPKSYDTTPETSKRMSRVHLKQGKAEVLLAKRLWHLGFRYRLNDKRLPGSPDIAILKYNIAIFVDGEFWHGKNWEERKSNVFKYEGSPFGYTKEMVDGYLKMKRALQSDEELLAVLLERGMNIQAYLSNNPAMQDAYNRFLTLCGTTS